MCNGNNTGNSILLRCWYCDSSFNGRKHVTLVQIHAKLTGVYIDEVTTVQHITKWRRVLGGGGGRKKTFEWTSVIIASVGPTRQVYDANASRVEELILRNRLDTGPYSHEVPHPRCVL